MKIILSFAWQAAHWRSTACLLALSVHGTAVANLTLAVVRNPDESYADYDTSQRYSDFVRHIRAAAGTPVRLILYSSAFEAAKKARKAILIWCWHQPHHCKSDARQVHSGG